MEVGWEYSSKNAETYKNGMILACMVSPELTRWLLR